MMSFFMQVKTTFKCGTHSSTERKVLNSCFQVVVNVDDKHLQNIKTIIVQLTLNDHPVGNSTDIYTGTLRPEVQPLTLLCNLFDEKYTFY